MDRFLWERRPRRDGASQINTDPPGGSCRPAQTLIRRHEKKPRKAFTLRGFVVGRVRA